MQAQQVVAALQRIAAKAVHVEACAPGHQDPDAPRSRVIQALEVVAPAPVLVDLVEHPQSGRRQLAAEDALAMLCNVPVEVAGSRVRQRERKRGLADLTWPSYKHHLPGEIPPDLWREIAKPVGHVVMLSVFLTGGENTNEYFLPR